MNRFHIIWLVFILGQPLNTGAAGSRTDIMPPDEVEFRIKHLSPELREEIKTLRYVLTPAELTELLELKPDSRQRSWIERYWRDKDPVFTTAENEVREEYRRRVEYARSNFYNFKRGRLDQRGEVYIRYGPPSFRQIIEAETDARGVSSRGEFWGYNWPDMVVLFDDALSDGNYTYYLRKGGQGSAMRMDRIGTPIDASIGIELKPPDIVYESIASQYEKKLNRFYEIQSTTPVSYRYDFEDQRLPVVFSVDNFRGGDFMDRVDVNIEFLAVCSGPSGGVSRHDYMATAVFWDGERREAGRRQQRLGIPVVPGSVDSTRWMPSQIVFSLPPGFYHLAVTVEELPSGRFNSFRTDVACEDFSSRLAVSDILFASVLQPVSRTTPFNRGPLEVVPHPLRRYRISNLIPVYFEIYNLKTDEQELSKYTLEYRLVPAKPRKTSWWRSLFGDNYVTEISSSLEGSAYGPHDIVHLSIRTDNLWADEYKIIVDLVDRNSGETFSREAAFTVLE